MKDKKQEVINALQLSDDEQLIEEVYELLQQDKTFEEMAMKELPQELQAKIERALNDYKNGNYITHSLLKQKVDQWLSN